MLCRGRFGTVEPVDSMPDQMARRLAPGNEQLKLKWFVKKGEQKTRVEYSQLAQIITANVELKLGKLLDSKNFPFLIQGIFIDNLTLHKKH